MSHSTLPGLARKRHDLRAEASIPVATTPVAPAAHLANDRSAPTFDDLPDPVSKPIGYSDIAGDDEPVSAAQARRTFAYPGIGAEVIAWLLEQDAAEQRPAAPTAPPARRDEHAFDADRLVPVTARRTLDPARVELRVETPVADLCAAAGLLYAKRHTTGLSGVSL